jgi:hypothetical protein
MKPPPLIPPQCFSAGVSQPHANTLNIIGGRCMNSSESCRTCTLHIREAGSPKPTGLQLAEYGPRPGGRALHVSFFARGREGGLQSYRLHEQVDQYQTEKWYLSCTSSCSPCCNGGIGGITGHFQMLSTVNSPDNQETIEMLTITQVYYYILMCITSKTYFYNAKNYLFHAEQECPFVN